MTKKEFKETCSFHQYGYGRNKRNAIYFDWQEGNNFRGYKYMMKTSVEFMTKQQLFNHMYEWVNGNVQPEWYVQYKIAHTNTERFKVSLMG